MGSALRQRLLAAFVILGLVTAALGQLPISRAEAAGSVVLPTGVDSFDVQAFLDRQPGVLKSYRDGKYRAAQAIEGYAIYYNLDARIVLTLLELVPGLIGDPNPAPETLTRPFGAAGPSGFVAQIDWAAREVRAGFGPYTSAPEARLVDGKRVKLSLDQDASLIAVQRFLAQGRTEAEWSGLKDRYAPLYEQLFGDEPETGTPTPRPSAGRPFLKLPWPRVYPNVPGDPLSGQPVRMVHSSYFDHVYPTVDRGSDGNDFVVNYQNRGNLSYNSHDGNDYYFPDRPTGTPVVAAADGIAYAITARGNGVVIRHQGAYAGYETIYWHLDAFEQKFTNKISTGEGVPVKAGDYLGTTGKTGFTIGGGHLHFEVRHNGKQVDPYGWQGPGPDPCAAWTVGCEASVWLWDDSLRGLYDFTSPDAPAAPDTEPPVGTLSITPSKGSDLGLLVRFDGSPVQSFGAGAPTIDGPAGAGLEYDAGVFGQAVRVGRDVALSYPISNNLTLESGAIAIWANLPEQYPANATDRQYLFAASNNPGDSTSGTYTGTLALRREKLAGTPRWNFWTVDDAGRRDDLVITDTLEPGWHQFVVSWEMPAGATKGTKQLYIDGVRVAASGESALPSSVGERLQIGRWMAGYGEIGAPLDELAVFTRALGEGEVRDFANRRDFLAGEDGPLGAITAVGDPSVILDTNAIDHQGGIVSVRLRRDDGPWGEPLPYYDSYRWTISGTVGLHTFAVEYRDRANNVTVVTSTVRLGAVPVMSVRLLDSSALTATIAVDQSGGERVPMEFQISESATFEGAPWQPVTATVAWSWQPDRPRLAYIRFRSLAGLAGPPLLVGDDAREMFLPLLSAP